jgi:hypothetical protein
LGRTFYHSANGGTALAQRTTLPGTPHPQPRGLWRDGAIRGLLYIAAGSDGCYKSVDGFNSSGGYYLIRKATIGTSPASANYSQIGANGILITAAVGPTTVVSDTTVRSLKLWNGSSNDAPPTGWQDPNYVEGPSSSGNTWKNAVIVTASGAPSDPLPDGSHPIWDHNGALSTSEQALFRRSFSCPAGTVSSAQVILHAPMKGAWLNGSFLPGTVHDGTQFTVTIPPSLIVPGATNVLAIWAYDDGTAAIGNGVWMTFKLSIS